MRDQLNVAARASGLSVSQEVEARLSRSLSSELESTYRDFGFPTEFALLRMIAETVKSVDDFTGQSWRTDLFTFLVMLEAIKTLLRAFRPDGHAQMPETIEPIRSLPPVTAELRASASYRSHRRFLENIKLDAWGEMLANKVLIQLEKAAAGDSEREVYKQAAIYLDRLRTDQHLQQRAHRGEEPNQ